MKVFVAGATGVAGRAAIRALIADGHDVTGLARTDEKAAELGRAGAQAARVDLFGDDLEGAVRGHDAVVNLATRIPTPERALLPGAWKENDRIRREGSRNLVDAALAAGARIYVQESLGFVYRDSGDEWIDEDAPMDVPSYAATVLDAEAETDRFRSVGTGVVLRFAQFYAAGTPHTTTVVGTARKGLSPFFGPPEAFSSMIHADDVGTAVAAALRAPSGIYNIVDNEPLRRRELGDILAAALGAGSLKTIPPPLAAVGGSKIRLLMRSQRLSNRRFREATGWNPSVPTAREGLVRVVHEMGGSDG